jgi:hypothetical protein
MSPEKPQEEGWTKVKGFDVPPPRDAQALRNLTTTPMDVHPRRIDEDPPDGGFPGSSQVEKPEIKDDTNIEDSVDAPTLPLKDTKIVARPLNDDEVSNPGYVHLETAISNEFSSHERIQVEWQGCKFTVIFDDVWIQKDEDTDECRWLTLVHNLTNKPEGPSWTPPTSTSDKIVSLNIQHNSTEYVCSYFGLSLFVPVCNLRLMVFLVSEILEDPRTLGQHKHT